MGPWFPNKETCDIFSYSSSTLWKHRPRVENFSAYKDQTSNLDYKPTGKKNGHQGLEQTRECSSFPGWPILQCTVGSHWWGTFKERVKIWIILVTIFWQMVIMSCSKKYVNCHDSPTDKNKKLGGSWRKDPPFTSLYKDTIWASDGPNPA